MKKIWTLVLPRGGSLADMVSTQLQTMAGPCFTGQRGLGKKKGSNQTPYTLKKMETKNKCKYTCTDKIFA